MLTVYCRCSSDREKKYAVVVLWVGHLIVYQTQAGSIPVHGAKQCRSGRAAHCNGLQIRKTVGSNPTSYSNVCGISLMVKRNLAKV